MRAALWGPDHAVLGRVSIAQAGDRAAIALSRGRYAKTYRHTDPNEDVAAAVAGGRATLLVCADGHNGATAAVRAVEAVLAELGDDPPPAPAGGADAWPALFGRVNAAVLDAVARSRQPSSRTVLVVALVSEGRLTWGALGDAALVVCRADSHRGRQVNREEMRFLGYPMSDRSLRGLVSRGDERLGPREWVVAVTDGLSEFTRPMRPAEVIPRVLGRAAATGDASPAAVARAIVDTAGDAGAGDNVAVAVHAPADESSGVWNAVPVPPVTRTSPPDRVFRELADAVLSRRDAAGEPLPSQQALTAELASLRERLNRLERLFRDVRHDDGTPADWRASSGLDVLTYGASAEPDLMAALFEARRLLLREAARLAAARCSAEQARELADLASRMAGARDDTAAQVIDLAFFAGVIEASGNLGFARILNSVRALYLERLELFRAIVGDREELVPHYAAAAAAISRGTEDAAAEAVDAIAAAQERRMMAALLSSEPEEDSP